MITHYTCPTCGYDRAVWHLRLNNSAVSLCENCLHKYSNRYSHVSGFVMNNSFRRKQVML